MLFTCDGQGLLIDAGVGIRTLMPALSRRGITEGQLCGVLLTHEHSDHLKAAPSVCNRLKAPLLANRATLNAASKRLELSHEMELLTGSEAKLGPFLVRSFAISHDAAEPCGYIVQAAGYKITYATDTGCASRELRAALQGSALCIIESNHDLAWLSKGPYPPFMKVRIASDLGHLSNEDAVNMMVERLEEGGPTCFWLAHLSVVNNSVSLARRFALAGITSSTRVPFHLDIALRDRPSIEWAPGKNAIQLNLL